MNDKILEPIENSSHNAILLPFEEALRSGKHISIEGGAIPIALKDSGGIHHGAFNKIARKETGVLLPETDSESHISAFDMTIRMMIYARSNGIDASLSLALWDIDGVPREQRKDVARRLEENQDMESIPDVYRNAVFAALGSRQLQRRFIGEIQILPQSKYEQSLNKRWQNVKRKIKKTKDVDGWAREHFKNTGQIFIVADDEGTRFSFLSTFQTREPFNAHNLDHPSEKVRMESLLPIVIAGESQCGFVAGGRMNEMRKNARNRSHTAKKSGVFTVNIQDLGVDAGGALKIARALYFQNLGAESDFDQHMAYILPSDVNEVGHVIHLENTDTVHSFDEAFELSRQRVVASMQIEDIRIYGTQNDNLTENGNRPSEKASKLMCSGDICALEH